MSMKLSLSQWLFPCIMTLSIAAAIMALSVLNFDDCSRLTYESLLGKSSEFPPPQYSPMRDNFADSELLQRAGSVVERAVLQTPRIAFLFLVRGDIPHEPLWRRFFQSHEHQYSLYVHASPGHRYPNESLFNGKEVPSQPCPRFSRAMVDAFRRLLAHAVLDPRYHNAWFVNVCESTIPIRSFAFTYQYLMTSAVSYVESFHPVERYHRWETLPAFNKTVKARAYSSYLPTPLTREMMIHTSTKTVFLLVVHNSTLTQATSCFIELSQT